MNIKIKLSSRGGQAIVFLVLAVVMLIGQYWLWAWVEDRVFEWHRVRSIGEQVKVITERTSEARRLLKEKELLLDQLSLVAPNTSQAPQLIDRLERLGDERGLSVVIKGILERKKSKEPEALEIRLEANGPVAGLLSYLQAVEHQQELTSVDNMTLLVSQEPGVLGSEGESFTMIMTVRFYVTTIGGMEGGRNGV